MKRVINVSEALYKTCIRLVDEGDPRPSESCIANSTPYNPTGDYISREALKNEIETWGCNDYDKHDFIEAIDDAPTVFTYTEDDMCQATIDGYDVAKRQYEFNTKNFKKFVESRVDIQDLYLPIHFFDLLDEYCGSDMKGGAQ